MYAVVVVVIAVIDNAVSLNETRSLLLNLLFFTRKKGQKIVVFL